MVVFFIAGHDYPIIPLSLASITIINLANWVPFFHCVISKHHKVAIKFLYTSLEYQNLQEQYLFLSESNMF